MPIVYGKNPVKELILSGETINKIYIQKGAKDLYEIKKLALDNKIIVVDSDKYKLDSMCESKNSQGIAASYTEYKYFDLDDVLDAAKAREEDPFVLILDKIEDPHNLGAIIRSAECMGVHGVVIQRRNACQVTDTVEKTSAGAVSYMKIVRVTNITSTIKTLKDKGLWIYGLDMDGEHIYNTDLKGPIAVVVGNEGDGISRLVKENCDGVIKIPMCGKINSLNASVSAGISIYEIKKQRDLK